MKACKLKIAGLILAVGICAYAEDASSLYASLSSGVVYIQNEFLFKSAESKAIDDWRALERLIKRPILDEAFPLASGSAFFIDSTGYLITNRHVVAIGDIDLVKMQAYFAFMATLQSDLTSSLSDKQKEALRDDFTELLAKSTVTMSLWLGNARLGEASLVAVGKDKDEDLALLKVDGARFTALKLADAGSLNQRLVGKDVASLGYPLGSTMDDLFKERTVTMNKGSVSAWRDSFLSLQHSAAISHGNSGGPLIDSSGSVLGVNTAGLTEAKGNSLFYAIDAGRIRAFLKTNGFEDILLWNSRISSGLDPDEAPRNALGEIETSASLILDVSKDTQISFDGSPIQTGPGFFTITQPTTKLTLTSPTGSYEATLRLLANKQSSTTLRPKLSARLESVKIETDVSGATVYADSRLLGVTPLEVELVPGSYRVICRLPGRWFDEFTLKVGPGMHPPELLRSAPAFPISLKNLPPAPTAELTVASPKWSRAFSIADALELPEGEYDLSVAGVPSLDNITIPLRVGIGPETLDVGTYVRESTLTIVGMPDTARLYVNDLRITNPGGETIELPLGRHTIQGWANGLQPLAPVSITVKDTGKSFITWGQLPGYDVTSKTKRTSGIILGATSIVLAGLGLIFDSNEVALANARTYEAYVVIKVMAKTALITGLLGFITGGGLEISAGRDFERFDEQIAEEAKLGGGK